MNSIIDYFLFNFPALQTIPKYWLILGFGVVSGSAFLGFIGGLAIFINWLERKVTRLVHGRSGLVTSCGWKSWIRFIADWSKLTGKEEVVPNEADRLIFRLAPLIVFISSFAAFAVVPFSSSFVVADLNIGIVYLFALLAVGSLGLFTAGLASNNTWSLYGAVRSVVQTACFVIPLGLSVIPVIIAAGSLNLYRIAVYQTGGVQNWIVVQNFPFNLLAFSVYFCASMIQVYRNPFSMPHVETEIAAGLYTEYSGINIGFFQLARYMNMFILAAAASILFWGGWEPPIRFLSVIPGIIWFLGKTVVIIVVQIWISLSFPSLRVDHLIYVAWKFLVILALLSIVGSGAYCIL